MCLSKKSTRSYHGQNNTLAALKEPGMSDVPVPFHLWDRRPELLKEAAPVRTTDCNQTTRGFLPGPLQGRRLLEDTDFLFKRDPDLSYPLLFLYSGVAEPTLRAWNIREITIIIYGIPNWPLLVRIFLSYPYLTDRARHTALL